MIRHQMIVPLLCVATVLVLMVLFFPHQKLSVAERTNFSVEKFSGETPLPDLSKVRDINLRKSRFFEYLLPLVQAENHRLADIRRRLVYIQRYANLNRQLDAEDLSWFDAALVEFRMAGRDVKGETFWQDLFLRADQLPAELVLVQAAIESAWGTSRFAREGNNLFGQWCFTPGCGMVPEGRSVGDTHEVARFASVGQSVASYMRNLNSGYAYDELREIRANLRLEGKPVTAVDLARGLDNYSERGDDYINDLLAMLRFNIPIIDKIRSPGPDKPEA